MKRILIVVLFVVLLSGCAGKEQEGSSSIVVTAGGETVAAYRDGEDVTDERMALEEQTEKAVSKFLNREREDLEFDMFCMLEQDGMTIEVMVDGVSYTFTCSMQGDIIGVGRTDGKRFGIR